MTFDEAKVNIIRRGIENKLLMTRKTFKDHERYEKTNPQSQITDHQMEGKLIPLSLTTHKATTKFIQNKRSK